MDNLIPVVIILGVIGFVLWKNKSKISGFVDTFRNRVAANDNREQVVTKPEAASPEAPYKVPDPVTKPDFGPIPPDPKPETGNDNWLTRAYSPTAETAAYRDALPARAGGDYFGQCPTNFPGSLLLGTGYGHAGKFKQAIVTVGLNPISFAIAVPENYEGSVYFDLTPFPGDSNGDASCTFIVKTWEGNVIVNKEGRLDQLKVMLGKGRGAVKVSRGTYLATVKASKDCKTIFSVTES